MTRFLSAVLLCVLSGTSGLALAQGATLAEMDHKSWTARDGAPQGVTTLAQGPDDVLWIGTEGGLFTFDGHSFSAFQSPPGEPDLPGGRVATVLVTREGAIWAGFRYGGIARIWRSHVTLYTQVDGLPIAGVKHIRQSSDGALWALRQQTDLIRFGADGIWHVEHTPLGGAGGLINHFFVDSSDTLWIAQGGRLFRRPLDQPKFFETAVAADFIFGFEETPDHTFWMNDSVTSAPGHPAGRTQHLDRFGKLLARLPDDENTEAILYAPDGSLIMLPAYGRIVRIPARELSGPALDGKPVRDDVFEQKDGLSSGWRVALLLDADANLWIGGQHGLDRFRSARSLVPFSPGSGESTTEKGFGPYANLCARDDGTVWISGDNLNLYEIAGDTTRIIPTTGQVYSMTCGPRDHTWLMANNGIFDVQDDRIIPVPSIPGVRASYADQVVATPDGNLFALVSYGTADVNGVWRLSSGIWTKLMSAGDSPGMIEYVDRAGRLWLGYTDGRVGLPLEGATKVLSSGRPGLGAVFTVLETSKGLFAAGLNGLAVLRDDHFEMLDLVDRGYARGIGGLVESANGDLWLNGQRGVVKLPAAELQSALQDPKYAMKSESYAEGDFVGPIELRRGKSTAGRDAAGRLWFLTMNGVFHVDPARLRVGGRLPNLSIKSVTADRVVVGDGGAIAPGTQTLAIQYLGVNLTTPEHVTYRYRLEGYDTAWQDVGHRTEAIYTQLRPGHYTFRVMASNGDGNWTAPVSTAAFTVMPRFYQTPWFLALGVLVALLILWLAFTVRVRGLTRAIRARAEERAEERVRIARDLHDTMLQGIQGLLLTVHVAAQKVAKGEDSRLLLERALTTADRIIIEGRNRVTGLRSEHLTDAELLGSIDSVGNDLKRDDRIEFRVKRAGIDAILHAHVADEVCFIAREALTNAFRHADASEITVEVTYGRRYFSLTCADNGRGFDPQDRQKPGHWGLKGLVERAQNVGGQLDIRSEKTRGTRIFFSLPSYLAYEGHSRFRFFLRAFRRSERLPTEP